MDVVTSDPEIMGGTPCFAGTRVPARSLLDYLEDGVTVDEYLCDFPGVKKDQALALLRVLAEEIAQGHIALRAAV